MFGKNYDKKIRELEDRTIFLGKQIKDIKAIFFDPSTKLSEYNRLSYLENCINAILKYLKIDVRWRWEIDKKGIEYKKALNRVGIENRKRVWEAVKIKKTKNKKNYAKQTTNN